MRRSVGVIAGALLLACAPTSSSTPVYSQQSPDLTAPWVQRRVSPDLKDPFGSAPHRRIVAHAPEYEPREHWSGYPAELEVRFFRAYERWGSQLDDWTLGSLAPALDEWIGPGQEVIAWLGDQCAPTILRRSEQPFDDPIDRELEAKVGVRETLEAGRRVRRYERMRLGHELVATGCEGTDVFEAGEWIEQGSTCLGDPQPLGTLAAIDGGVAWYSAPVGRPQVVCAPHAAACSGGSACPSCGVMTWSPDGQQLTGWSAPPPDCSDECRIDMTAVGELSELLARYGARPRATRELAVEVHQLGVAVHLDELSCRVAATRRF